MRKKIVLIIVVLLIVVIFITVYALCVNARKASKPSNTMEQDENALLRIEQVDYSIKNEEGKSVGITYYDKPVLSGDSDVIRIINTHYQNECQSFFYGKNRVNFDGARSLEHFTERVNGTSFDLEEYHYYNTLDTKVTYNSNNILSFSQATYWAVGGVEPQYGYGATFDMQTGDLLTLDYFVNVSIDEFRDRIENFIIERFIEWDGEEDAASSINYLKESLSEMGYKDYEYYYDGDAIYLLLNQIVFSNGCYVLRWDMQTDELNDDYIWSVRH